MLCVHKHMDTYPETMSVMMRVFMGSMTPRGYADLRTSLQISLTKKGSGGVRAPWRFTLTRVSRVWGVLHIHISPRLEVTQRE